MNFVRKFLIFFGTFLVMLFAYQSESYAKKWKPEKYFHANTIQDSLKFADSILDVADNYVYRLKGKDALTLSSFAYQLADQTKDTSLLIRAQSCMADSWLMMGHNEESFHSYMNALNLQKYKPVKGIGKTYYKIGVVLAKMKIYPLSLIFFNKSQKVIEMHNGGISKNVVPDTVKQVITIHQFPPENSIDTQYVISAPQYILTDDLLPDSLLFQDTVLVDNNKVNKKSYAVRAKEDIIDAFDDHKIGRAYGIILQVKQPSFGKRKQFVFLNNVGHMFITLVKFNTDNTSVARTFGFYPDKNNFFSATPVSPQTNATFKNDALHDWDELVGKFVSENQFKLVLDLVQRYHSKKYHLSNNNCTDFGLIVAHIAGIQIENTKGSWPGGAGNNPGDLGQSIFEGNVSNTDSKNQEQLFIYPFQNEKELPEGKQ